MSNRTTVKSNIDTLNVPSVTNEDMGEMLKDNICDNVVFREDVAIAQTSTTSNVTLNFTGKDRIELTRTGGSLNITASGMDDGDTKYLLITKTAGQAVTFVGITDVTPVKYHANALSTVLYEIVRKGSNYYTKAWVETVLPASKTEAQTGTNTYKFITPNTLQDVTATSSRNGIGEIATLSEAKISLTNDNKFINGYTLGAVTKHKGLSITANGTYQMSIYEGFVCVTGGNGAVIVRLPDESIYSFGKCVRILNLSGCTITVQSSGGGAFMNITHNWSANYELNPVAGTWVCTYNAERPMG